MYPRVIFLAFVVALLGQAPPTAAAPVVVQYNLTGDNQFPEDGYYSVPLTYAGGAIVSGSLTLTLYAADCATPPVTGSGVCLRNFEFLTTQGEDFYASSVQLSVRNLTRGPALALNLFAARFTYACSGCVSGTALIIRAGEAGQLEPIGTRSPLFSSYVSTTFASTTYGTFIVGREVATIPGDANQDNRVDGADYTIWADNFGEGLSGGASDGDFNEDGVADAADYTVWADNFGTGTGGGGAWASAAEPSEEPPPEGGAGEGGSGASGIEPSEDPTPACGLGFELAVFLLCWGIRSKDSRVIPAT